ncbi:hypothetical protein [Streptomyces sp. NBC_00859]|uniref:hypothetical protein n=1 Tax=Streptomyces sp. NBC_00859 TaxID=2903682 RepID=UPI00386DCCA8|nr:DUF3592 domain-containing protein [Streptomyces sp. NBC_00859]
MMFVTLTALMLLSSIGTIASKLRRNMTLRRMRPHAIELSGEVIDNSATRSGKAGAYFLTPVVRYYINGKRYESDISNPVFNQPVAVGSWMTILVSPDNPYSPMDPYGGLGSMMRSAIFTTAVSALLFVWALALL